jgi:hypothetical protein
MKNRFQSLPFKCNLQRYTEAVVAALGEDDKWDCADNPDHRFADCAVQEEVYVHPGGNK